MARRLSDALLLGSFALDPAAIALSDTQKPQSWVQVGKVGKGFKHAIFGEFDITETMLSEMEKNGNEASAATQVPLDYNHLSFGAQVPDQAVAAGWFQKFERRDDGKSLWGFAEWTPKAAKHIADKEFRYISPLFFPKAADEFGKDIGARLVSAALTIYPFLKGMAAVSLSELHRLGVVQLIDASNLSIDERRSRVTAAIQKRFERSDMMDPMNYVWARDIYDDYVVVDKGGKLYRIDYSFNDEGSVELGDSLTEVVTTYEEVASLTEGEPTMSVQNNNNAPSFDIKTAPEFIALKEQADALKGVVDSLKASSEAAQNETKQLREELLTTRAEGAVSALIAAGKILPAQKEAWITLYKKDVDSFKSLSEGLQVVVKLNAAHGADSTTSDNSDDAIAELEGGQDPVEVMDQKVVALMEKDSKLRVGDAIKMVANENPKLFEHYRAAFVKAGSGNMNVVQ